MIHSFLTMDQPFSQYFGTNYAPSDEECLEINNILEQPRARLLQIEEEISRVEKILSDLHRERDSVSDAIDKYAILLTPIRRIPRDVLQEIFIRCLPTDRNAVMASNEAPLLLGRVCSSWRTTSRSTPQLWSTIHIPIPRHHASFYALDIPPGDYSELAGKVVEVRATVARDWLLRSGSCPLDISLNQWDEAPSTDPDLPRPLLTVIVPFSERWRKVSITAPIQSLSSITALSPAALPNLESLSLNFSRVRSWGYGVEPTSNVNKDIFRAPKLTSLALTQLREDALRLSVKWAQLTELSLEGNAWSRDSGLSPSRTLQLLSMCPQLVRCRLEVGIREINEELDAPSVRLSKLQSFSIFDAVGLGPAFERLDLPALDDIEFHTSIWPGSIKTSLFTLLSRLHLPIRTMTTDPQIFTKDDFLETLSIVPSLKTLTLKRSLVGSPSPWTEGPGTPDVARLDDAMLQRLLLPDEQGRCLFPHLNTFEIFSDLTFRDETLLQCIEKRVSSEGVTKLKRVYIQFNRQKGIDILPALSSFIEDGLSIDLCYLAYQQRGPFSPSDGLPPPPLPAGIPWFRGF